MPTPLRGNPLPIGSQKSAVPAPYKPFSDSRCSSELSTDSSGTDYSSYDSTLSQPLPIAFHERTANLNSSGSSTNQPSAESMLSSGATNNGSTISMEMSSGRDGSSEFLARMQSGHLEGPTEDSGDPESRHLPSRFHSHHVTTSIDTVAINRGWRQSRTDFGTSRHSESKQHSDTNLPRGNQRRERRQMFRWQKKRHLAFSKNTSVSWSRTSSENSSAWFQENSLDEQRDDCGRNQQRGAFLGRTRSHHMTGSAFTKRDGRGGDFGGSKDEKTSMRISKSIRNILPSVQSSSSTSSSASSRYSQGRLGAIPTWHWIRSLHTGPHAISPVDQVSKSGTPRIGSVIKESENCKEQGQGCRLSSTNETSQRQRFQQNSPTRQVSSTDTLHEQDGDRCHGGKGDKITTFCAENIPFWTIGKTPSHAMRDASRDDRVLQNMAQGIDALRESDVPPFSSKLPSPPAITLTFTDTQKRQNDETPPARSVRLEDERVFNLPRHFNPSSAVGKLPNTPAQNFAVRGKHRIRRLPRSPVFIKAKPLGSISPASAVSKREHNTDTFEGSASDEQGIIPIIDEDITKGAITFIEEDYDSSSDRELSTLTKSPVYPPVPKRGEASSSASTDASRISKKLRPISNLRRISFQDPGVEDFDTAWGQRTPTDFISRLTSDFTSQPQDRLCRKSGEKGFPMQFCSKCDAAVLVSSETTPRALSNRSMRGSRRFAIMNNNRKKTLTDSLNGAGNNKKDGNGTTVHR